MYIRIVCSCIWTANYSHSMRQEYPRFPLTIFSVNDSADPLISSKTNSSIYPAIYALCLSKPKGAKQNRFEHNLSTMRFFIAIVATLAVQTRDESEATSAGPVGGSLVKQLLDSLTDTLKSLGVDLDSTVTGLVVSEYEYMVEKPEMNNNARADHSFGVEVNSDECQFGAFVRSSIVPRLPDTLNTPSAVPLRSSSCFSTRVYIVTIATNAIENSFPSLCVG
ncbi:hypothetical protein F5B18DRAFT_586518 [Nemania serpens]|nr:hypothetical protein F5B18DRAFT_586518 [Nemania serpens]